MALSRTISRSMAVRLASRRFKRVIECLGVNILMHMPSGSDGRRTTARAKGKVERPFRTVKEAHETLYHFHEPASEEEANRWLARYIATYNGGNHRREPHSRIDDWLGHLPNGGTRAMCSWDIPHRCNFASFANFCYLYRVVED